MTVIFRRNDALELNLCEFAGPIGIAELKALAKYLADHTEFLGSDTFNLVRASADFSAISVALLDALFDYYRVLFSPLRLQIFRRAVWYCEGEAAKAHVAHWVSQDTRESMSSTLKQCHSLAESAEWLLLTASEAAALETGEGFQEVVRFHLPAEAARAL